MDKIIIKGLKVMACHGVLPKEQETPQPFVLDVTLDTDLRAAGQSDALTDSVSYADVALLVEQTVRESRAQLLERVAAQVAAQVLTRFPVQRVTVRLCKPQAPIPAAFDTVGVEITRTREDL